MLKIIWVQLFIYWFRLLFFHPLFSWKWSLDRAKISKNTLAGQEWNSPCFFKWDLSIRNPHFFLVYFALEEELVQELERRRMCWWIGQILWHWPEMRWGPLLLAPGSRFAVPRLPMRGWKAAGASLWQTKSWTHMLITTMWLYPPAQMPLSCLLISWKIICHPLKCWNIIYA